MKRGPKPLRRLWAFTCFALFYLRELVVANLQVAYSILSVHPRIRPGVIAVRLDLQRDISRLVLSNLLTMTPGTLTLDISSDRSVLYIHMLYLAEDPDKNRRRIKGTFEKRIRELFEND